MGAKLRKNPASTWPAKAVEWPVATNAGPFLPQMFPYGTGGIRQDYALKNSSVSVTKQAVAKVFPNCSDRVRFMEVPNRGGLCVIWSISEQEHLSLTRPRAVVAAWQSDENGGHFAPNVGVGEALKFINLQDAQTAASQYVQELMRGKLCWFAGSTYQLDYAGHDSVPIASTRHLVPSCPGVVRYLSIQPAVRSTGYRVIEAIQCGSSILVPGQLFHVGSKNKFDTLESARAMVELDWENRFKR